MNNRKALSVEEYESFFKRFDNLEFDRDTELAETPKGAFYLDYIEDHIRSYNTL